MRLSASHFESGRGRGGWKGDSGLFDWPPFRIDAQPKSGGGKVTGSLDWLEDGM